MVQAWLLETIAWLEGLKPQTAQFLGALVGWALGLIALLVGALANSALNRRRDNLLRNDERRSVTTAIHAELVVVRDSLLSNANEVEHRPPGDGEFIHAADPSDLVSVYPQLVSKLGLLDAGTVRSIVTAYGTIPSLSDSLILQLGGRVGQVISSDGRRRRIAIHPAQAANYAILSRNVAETLSEAIVLLEKGRR